jgi:hypothetical protein
MSSVDPSQAHPLEAKYRAVWQKTLRNRCLSAEDVANSRFFFSFEESSRTAKPIAVPKRFDTYGIIVGLPFSESLQATLEVVWQRCLLELGNPLSYGVEPANRHTEIFLFQRPGELFAAEQRNASLERSLMIAREMAAFQVTFRHPFITPDGTIVLPGFDDPPGIVADFRSSLRSQLPAFPQQQSQWLHISLGRVLEPMDARSLEPFLISMQSHWGEMVAQTQVDELLWVWEKQWYMVDREVVHRRRLL